MLQAAKDQTPDISKGDAVIILLGKTGVGKSTTIQYLCGCNMKQFDKEHIQAVDLGRNPYLERIVSKGGFDSVTRYCSAIFNQYRDPITNQ